MKTIPTILLVLLLTGCSTPKVWYQSGVSADQTRRDLARARLASDLHSPAGRNLFIPGEGAGGALLWNSSQQNGQRKAIVRDAMIAAGYQIVPANTISNSTQYPHP